MMKRLTMIAASLLLMGSAAFAQQSRSDETLEFRPHWSLGLQGGLAHTRGEQSFGELLSPAAQITATYNFHHGMGVRFGFGGWQGKGAAFPTGGVRYEGYSYNFAQLNADYMLDLCGLFGGFRHDRVASPYLFFGLGGMYAFNNEEAGAYKDILDYYWEGGKLFLPLRAGVGVDFRLSRLVSLGLEANSNYLSDRFNSKKADNPDWQFNFLVGLKFAFGGNTRPSKVYAEKVAAEEAARAAAEAERLAAEKLAAEKAAREAAERAEAERLAAERAAREAAERAAAEHAAKAAENSDNVFFTIGSYAIRKTEDAKIVALAEWMNANPDFTVSLVGYADKQTGTSKGNEKLSANRAKVVKERLESLGVDGSRIMTAYKGDTVQPFAENAKNRVVLCTLE